MRHWSAELRKCRPISLVLAVALEELMALQREGSGYKMCTYHHQCACVVVVHKSSVCCGCFGVVRGGQVGP